MESEDSSGKIWATVGIGDLSEREQQVKIFKKVCFQLLAGGDAVPMDEKEFGWEL